MNIYRIILLLLILLGFSGCGLAQENARLVGGPCEGCEAVFDYGDRKLLSIDTLPGFEETEDKIKVTGTIYKNDGKTPAKGVILFVHHTNRDGVYPKHGNENGWARQYGYIHGWIKTGADGKYAFYTFKPAPYGGLPAHIHPIIREPDGKYYWLGSFLFAGDPQLTEEHKNPESSRGGSNGILSLKKEKGIVVGRRDIILGKNIPNYE
ncbi:protocatechuate 3,4-dioxygenase beta subunit [Gillisia sp. Hel_I_86]|uniref:intradiol ring-cleavage dioxygenase n=1 Tax=Gillisia sp. Hel_I_86 TaxID=1249981 RepID=UPI00119C64C1|nr:intradiol ring-cleavage dioxygenase [Gillisia sp. Hel_I_86]TVZ26987.1 protocatechuate 3,4-dioxygenase beta subunit [Gillisia sp. Hel_I_86]